MAKEPYTLADAIHAWQEAVEEAPRVFGHVTEPQAESPRRPGSWSRKQVIGHLIDSAANNHHRFVLMQIDRGRDLPSYSQEMWVAAQCYQQRPWRDLVELWMAYNRHLLHVVRQMPPSVLSTTARLAGQGVSLEFVIVDYVRHLSHHIAQIAEPL